jgi:hypothetical protein
MMLSIGLRHHLSVSEEVTTETEEKAMAAPASIGCIYRPNGSRIPIARGIPMTL